MGDIIATVSTLMVNKSIVSVFAAVGISPTSSTTTGTAHVVSFKFVRIVWVRVYFFLPTRAIVWTTIVLDSVRPTAFT